MPRAATLRASEVYAAIMAQPGFAPNSGAAVRLIIRNLTSGRGGLLGTNWRRSIGREYWSHGPLNNPKADHCVTSTWISYIPKHYKTVIRYNYEDIQIVAAELKFHCPVCRGINQHQQQHFFCVPGCLGTLVCARCHATKLRPARLEVRAIESLIHDLEKEANNVRHV